LNKNQRGYFVSAIHTDSGKTLASAALVQSLKAHYWKPIQCGNPTDTGQIHSWLGETVQSHPERYYLQTPASPHFAAEKENKSILLEDFQIPETFGSPIIVEGAGGLLVPLTKDLVLADLIKKLGLPVVLVINHYLGALNHSLLTISELKHRKIDLAGIIFNGVDFQNAEQVILSAAKCPCILRIPPLQEVNREVITALAQKIQWN